MEVPLTRCAVAVLVVFSCLNPPLWAEDPTPTIDDLAWLAGSWHGTAFGGTFEETWNLPSGGSMVGMFKLLRDGRVEMYEIMRIAPVDGEIVLEVKHFTADFVAWEAEDVATRFPLVSARDGSATFDGLAFNRLDDGRVDVKLTMKNSKTGDTRTETLIYHPVGAPPPRDGGSGR
jgi:hypothetical protein